MAKIEIRDLTFSYPGRENPAIKHIDLTINQGEFITLCGKSGCGKSTLLRQLKPIISPHGEKSGEILFDGKEIGSLSQREEAQLIGYVSQNPDDQIVCDKVWHELAFGLESLAYSNTEIRARVSEMASFFGIQNWFYKNVWELSGGQKQTLNLASVMVLSPSILILDEPTSQLDPIASEDFLNTLAKINKELGVTVILSEHKLENCFMISDRVVVMEDGEVIADCEPARVGKILKDRNSDMQKAMPTAIKVFYSKEDADVSPITVRDGRVWLGKQEISNNQIIESKTGEAKLQDDIIDKIDGFKYCKKYEKNDDPQNTSKKNEIIKLEDVWFRYEKDMPDILKGLNLSIYENELYAMVGGNGAGKTTTLSIISGLNKAYRGKITLPKNKKIGVLPQNPQSIFVKKTVLLDLKEALDQKEKNLENEAILDDVIKFCELEGLLYSHPYDLSGGEMQRVALAKVLLTRPDILLLDEPTKGLDAHFKEKLGTMLRKLIAGGMTIIMVSHDIEFCAEYADHVGMFFDGDITSQDVPRKFFSGKNFYTTSANRMARDVLPEAVLCEDIINAIKEPKEICDMQSELFIHGSEERQECTLYRGKSNIDSSHEIKKTEKIDYKRDITENIKKPSKINIVIGIIFIIAFACIQYFLCGKYEGTKEIVAEISSIIVFGIGLLNLVPKKNFSTLKISEVKKKEKLSKRTVVAILMTLLLIPLTIFVGIYFLDDRKYYFISLLIILETMLPFAMIFEGRKPKAREIVIISVICAIGVVGRCAFVMLPQFKPVLAIVIIAGVCFGGESGFLVGAMTAFVSNMFFGQGPWTPWQMFSFGIIGLLAGILFQKGIINKSKIELCIYGFFAAIFIFGGIMNPASLIMWQGTITKEMLIVYYIQGLPFDLIQATATVFFLWFCAEPMCEKLERVKYKYGLIE